MHVLYVNPIVDGYDGNLSRLHKYCITQWDNPSRIPSSRTKQSPNIHKVITYIGCGTCTRRDTLCNPQHCPYSLNVCFHARDRSHRDAGHPKIMAASRVVMDIAVLFPNPLSRWSPSGNCLSNGITTYIRLHKIIYWNQWCTTSLCIPSPPLW